MDEKLWIVRAHVLHTKLERILNELNHDGYDVNTLLEATVPDGKKAVTVVAHKRTSQNKVLESLQQYLASQEGAEDGPA